MGARPARRRWHPLRLRHVGQGPALRIMAMPLPHGPARSLVRGVYATYSPTGHLLVVTSDGKLIGIPFDPKKLELTGAPIALLEGGCARNAGFNITCRSPERHAGLHHRRTLGPVAAWVTREGLVTPVDSGWDPQGVIGAVSLSPDGKALAVSLTRDGRRDIWVKRLPWAVLAIHLSPTPRAAAPPGRPTGDVSVCLGPPRARCRPDLRPPCGRHRSPRLLSSLDVGQATSSRDGRWLILRTAPGTGTLISSGSKAGDTSVCRWWRRPPWSSIPRSRPNGRWLAYSSNESGRREVYVRPFPRNRVGQVAGVHRGRRRAGLVEQPGGSCSTSTAKGRHVSAESGGRHLSVASRRTLFSTSQFVREAVPSYSLSPDGKRFVRAAEGRRGSRELVVGRTGHASSRGCREIERREAGLLSSRGAPATRIFPAKPDPRNRISKLRRRSIADAGKFDVRAQEGNQSSNMLRTASGLHNGSAFCVFVGLFLCGLSDALPNWAPRLVHPVATAAGPMSWP